MNSLVYGFTISTGAVRLLGSVSTGEARERLGALHNLWKRNGILVTDPGQRHTVELGKAASLKSFPPGMRKLIKEFLAVRGLPRAEARNWPLSSTQPPQDVEAPAQGSWFVGEVESAEWGLDKEKMTALARSGIEICRLDGLSQSRWNAAPTSRVLPKKYPTSDAFHAFGPMCGVAKVLDVVDPYCGKDEVVAPGRSGLVRYLTGVATSEPCFGFRLRELCIYSSKDVTRSMTNNVVITGSEIAEAWRAAGAVLAAHGIRRIVLHLVAGVRFSAIAHDRFAVFRAESLGKAGNCAFQVGPGFSVFEGKRLSKATTMAAVPADDVTDLIMALEGEVSHEVHYIEHDRAQSVATV